MLRIRVRMQTESPWLKVPDSCPADPTKRETGVSPKAHGDGYPCDRMPRAVLWRPGPSGPHVTGYHKTIWRIAQVWRPGCGIAPAPPACNASEARRLSPCGRNLGTVFRNALAYA